MGELLHLHTADGHRTDADEELQNMRRKGGRGRHDASAALRRAFVPPRSSGIYFEGEWARWKEIIAKLSAGVAAERGLKWEQMMSQYEGKRRAYGLSSFLC